jgi:hypothetical protein
VRILKRTSTWYWDCAFYGSRNSIDSEKRDALRCKSISRTASRPDAATLTNRQSGLAGSGMQSNDASSSSQISASSLWVPGPIRLETVLIKVSNSRSGTETRSSLAVFLNGLVDTGADAVTNLIREFILKGITTHVPKEANGQS